MILVNDDLEKADGASGEINIDTRRIERDASLHNTFATSEPIAGRTESIDASGPTYGVEEGRYIEESAPGLESSEQHMKFAPLPRDVRGFEAGMHECAAVAHKWAGLSICTFVVDAEWFASSLAHFFCMAP